VTSNTAWNAQGTVVTEAERIRNVRVGDVYNTHAYYAEAQTADNARIWAIDLATGESNVVNLIPSVSGSGSWGLWTIKEVDGFMYVHTSHDGVYVYGMDDALSVTPLVTHYEKEELDDLMEDTTPNWGFDVADSGRIMLLGGSGKVIQIGGSLTCDFDGDGGCDGADIDALMNEVAAGTNGATFDLNGDGLVDDGDRDAWLAEAGPLNALSAAYLVGDANLDGTVGAGDLNALALTWQSDNHNWTNGNFTGGSTNAADLNELALNWQQSVPTAAQSVPEPASMCLVLVALVGLAIRARAASDRD
jgi:hypothetical protein